ncbi:methyltransferase [Candidatus Woesearchaeota archaeon]|nr:methyltransferase [Candidatus Woesearchaeota archaeon]
MMKSKKELAVSLSKLKVFAAPDIRLEQYSTDSEIAAEMLWFAYQNGDIENKIIADFGCGTGILGIGCLLLNARLVYFIDKAESVFEILKENLFTLKLKDSKIINKEISAFNNKVDVVIQNPPFGVKSRHADKIFLEKAFSLSEVVYSFHKIESMQFIESISKENNFRSTHLFGFEFPLKKSYEFHRKKVYKVKVGCWRLEKKYI